MRTARKTDFVSQPVVYTWDVMGDLAFGKPFTNMITGKEHPAIHAMHDHVGVIGSVVAIPWFPVLIKATGLNIGFTEFSAITSKILEDKERVSRFCEAHITNADFLPEV